MHPTSESDPSPHPAGLPAMTRLLDGVRIVLFALNVPGPVAAHRLSKLGATVIKVEPPTGDPLIALSPDWYRTLHENVDVRHLDLRSAEARETMGTWLDAADLFITSFRPSSLTRLGLGHEVLLARYPRLHQIAIVGEGGERAEIAGHDLTYQATAGLLSPPAMPATLLADLTGAERVVSAALALLLGREREHTVRYAEVALSDSVRELMAPWHLGLTSSAGPLGGVNRYYRLYATQDGWIALAALEPQFVERLCDAIGLTAPSAAQLETLFASDTSAHWERWAMERDLPIAAVRESPLTTGRSASEFPAPE